MNPLFKVSSMLIYEPEPGLPFWLGTRLEQVWGSQLLKQEKQNNSYNFL
jgi:hypothetical protein